MEVIVKDLDRVAHASELSSDARAVVQKLRSVLSDQNLCVGNCLSYIVTVLTWCCCTKSNRKSISSIVEPDRIICLLSSVLEAVGLTDLKSQIGMLPVLRIS